MIITVILAVTALGFGVLLYLAFAPGPRRAPPYRRAQRVLSAGAWEDALAIVASLQPDRQSSIWRARLRHLAGECHQYGLDLMLKEREFDRALGHAEQAAALLNLEPAEQRGRVVEAMLAEVRRLFAAGPAQGEALRDMIIRTAQAAGTQPAEATFWQALSLIRQGEMEQAQLLLSRVCEEVGKQVIDAPLYMGILLHRLGRPQEALRYLGDANRIDSNCPFVPWQMGVSLIASGGDSSMAVRALQRALRALGSRGLGAWLNQQERVWIEAFPEARSYIRRLATRHRFVCPLLGGDLNIILRQGQLALAQAFYRQERFQEAADLYGKLLQDSPPTLMLLRGYGLSLARLGQHDQAYKHLRIALEQEDPKDPFTAGYLALCGALGRPTNPDDKPRNITWAMRLLARYPMPGNAEWAGLIASVHAEARKVGMQPGVEEQLLLCDSLASVEAHDPRAATFYAHLARGFPDVVKPVHAWLYARAAAVHGVSGPMDLDLFARTFQDAAAARVYFEKRNWDFNEVEYTYLARSASQSPGKFPAALGPDYPAQGEAFLLARSQQHEQKGLKDPAREAVEVLLSLAPTSLAAHDRLACLHYRTGNVDRAVELLDGWQRLAPSDHWPLVRQAIIEQERGNAQRRTEVIDRALGLTRGPLRAAIAFLGAKLALRSAGRGQGSGVKGQKDSAPFALTPELLASQKLLEECLHEQPDHIEALWCLAAVRSVLGDGSGLAAQAPLMDRPSVRDARFHFLGAVCHLAAKDYRRVLELGERAAQDPALEVESRFVMAWARLHIGEIDSARQLLRKVVEYKSSPSAVYARALLGQLSYRQGAVEEAIQAWSGVEPAWRARLGLDEPLRHTVYLSGLIALEEKRYEQAADRFREAGKLGLRERRLGSLITLALVKAGQRLLFSAADGGK